MGGRVFSATGVAGVLLVLGWLAVGCTPGPPTALRTELIDGLRSDPDHRGLVVSYTGGMCDGASRLVLTESPTRIEATVEVDSGGGGACPGAGVLKTVGARLTEPIGARTVWSGDREQVPFDGARLLTPSTLPANYTGVSERGFATERTATSARPLVTTTWVTRRFDPGPVPTDEQCRPSRGTIEVRIGPASGDRSRGRTAAGRATVGAATAHLYREGSSKKPVGWAYVWTVDHRTVEVASLPDCPGDQPLSRTELLGVARSLRPG